MDKPKAKRNHRDVPDGLVGEFAEYSALLRALSIGTTSDLTGQLLRHEQARRLDEGLLFGEEEDSHEEEAEANDEEEEAGSDDEESMYDQPIEGPRSSSPPPWPPSTSPIPSSPLTHSLPLASSSPPPPTQASHKRKLPTPTTSARKRRTMMAGLTRWPLLLEDVPKPEWTLQDEVGVLMAQLHLDDDDEEENQNQSEIITLSTTHFLESLLGTIAGYTPRRADSMQNRMNTVDWRFVLRATTSREFMDSRAVRKAERRLRAMYGGGGGSSGGTDEASGSNETSPRRGPDREDDLNEILHLPPWAPEPQVDVREVKRRNKPEGVPRRKYEWKDGRKLKRDLVAAAKVKREAERPGG